MKTMSVTTGYLRHRSTSLVVPETSFILKNQINIGNRLPQVLTLSPITYRISYYYLEVDRVS